MEPNQPKLHLDQRLHPTQAERLHHPVETRTDHHFDSVEAMLRQDRDMTLVPDTLAERLDASLLELPPPRPWWRRWLGIG